MLGTVFLSFLNRIAAGVISAGSRAFRTRPDPSLLQQEMTTRGGWASDGEEGTNYQGTTRSRATTGFNGVPTSTRDQPEVPAKLQPHQTQGRTTGPLLIKGEEAQQPSSSCLGRVWSYLCVLDRFAKIDLRTTIDTRR